MELGPQYETKPLKHPLSKEDTKRKREAIMYSALKRELGPWAQTIAERQVEQKNKKLRSKQKLDTDRLPKINGTAIENLDDKKGGNSRLPTWRKAYRTDPRKPPVGLQVINRRSLPRISRLNVDVLPSTVDKSNNTHSDMGVLGMPTDGNATTIIGNNN
ncbi:hypothetical protein QAD02_008784 [Eretmocerus hayati]|uniref:Uncharacterized protein n=1 Tax=Eretmocerus hayati TaxID=131215 RepID=A0ACC2N9W2_9HYME|nr:hypothetical protein QAD02_008784 [Eretmocerus hayati]